jgi:hypothetical protein
MTCIETLRLDARPYPEHLVRAARALLADAVRPPLDPGLAEVARLVRTRYPGHAAQVDESARDLGVDPLVLTLGQLSYDLTLSQYACSTMALATPDGPVVARNMDWMPANLIARASCVVPTAHGWSAGFVGGVGVVTGLSRRGFAVVLNAVVGGGPDLEGYPVLLFLRHLLDEARDFDDALERATATRLSSPALLTLAGMHNDQRAVVERTPTRAAVRRADGDEPLLTTNHYRLLGPADEYCDRFPCLNGWTKKLPARPGVEDLLGLLSRPPVFNEITAQHVVLHPATGLLRMWVPSALLADGGHGGPGALRELLGGT